MATCCAGLTHSPWLSRKWTMPKLTAKPTCGDHTGQVNERLLTAESITKYKYMVGRVAYRKFKLALAATCFGIVTASASAATLTTFNDRSAFSSAAGSTIGENFNSFASEVDFRTAPLTIGGITLSMLGTSQPGRNFIDVPPHQYSVFNVDGTPIANIFTNSTSSVELTFASAVTAFGADFASYQDVVVRSRITVLGQDLVASAAPATAVRFYGFTSDTPFTSLRFQYNGMTDGFGLDNLAYALAPVPSEDTVGAAPAVPEPAAWLTMLLGFALAGTALRKRRVAPEAIS